jgi:hypothetical protein
MGGLRFASVVPRTGKVKIWSPDVQTFVEHDLQTAVEIARFILRETGESAVEGSFFG